MSKTMKSHLPGDDKVIVGAETADGINDISFVILNDFNLFQTLTQS